MSNGLLMLLSTSAFLCAFSIASAQQIPSPLPDTPTPHVRERGSSLLPLLSQAAPGGIPAGSPQQPPPASAGASARQPLTREQAEQLALRNNPRVTEAGLLALAQKEVVTENRAGYLPGLNAALTAERAEEGSRLSSGALSASRLLNHAGTGVALNQLITDFGRTRNLVASSSFQAKAADQSTLATREEIVLAADLAFYRALEAQATLAVAQSTVQARASVNEQVTALTASKLKSTLDQSFSEVNLSQAQLLQMDAQNQSDAAMASLNEILGSAADQQYGLVDESGPLSAVPASADDLIAQAMARRPDLQALRLTHESDVRFARAQRDQLLPAISALGVVGYTPWDPPDNGTDYFLENWYGGAGVNLSVPVFEGFRYHAEAREATYRARAAEERTRQLTDTIARDVRTAWLAANTSFQRIAVTQKLVDQASTALQLAQTRYTLGLSSIVELSQAQLDQTQAQIANTNARYQYESDLAALRFQTATQP